MANAVERRLTNFTTAATIRQPCERFMSAFHYAKKPNNAQKGVRMRQKFLIDEFDDVSEWVAWLEKSRLWDDLRGQWSHFMPMWYWLMYDDKTFGIDVVMCQEHWNEGIHRLSKAINRQVPDSVLSHKNGALHPSCDALDIATRERIMKAYELDACLFGYQDDLLPIKAPNERPTCIGKSRTTMFFTRRFRDCHNMLYGTTYV